jgi:post-segregation antitoxin (ccd killing protein)
MKITIDLPDDLLQRAKTATLDVKTTLDAFIETALRQALAKPRDEKPGR